jgi:hypothetical protein
MVLRMDLAWLSVKICLSGEMLGQQGREESVEVKEGLPAAAPKPSPPPDILCNVKGKGMYLETRIHVHVLPTVTYIHLIEFIRLL